MEDSAIVDIVQGLETLANIDKEEYKTIAAGLHCKLSNVIIKNMGRFLSSRNENIFPFA